MEKYNLIFYVNRDDATMKLFNEQNVNYNINVDGEVYRTLAVHIKSPTKIMIEYSNKSKSFYRIIDVNNKFTSQYIDYLVCRK